MHIHVIKGYISDLFIAEYPDRILVLDSGCASDVATIADFIETGLNRSISDVRLVISSHTHPDHAGGNAIWQEKYGIPIAAPATMNNWYAGMGGFVQHKVDMLLGQWVALVNKKSRKKIYYRRSTLINHPLSDGDRLPFFPGWQVIACPGHTAHDMVFYHVPSQTIYAADVVLNIKGKYLPPFPVVFPVSMEKSVTGLINLPVKRLLLAHGGDIITGDFRQAVRNVVYALRHDSSPLFKRLAMISRFSRDIGRSGLS